MSDLTETDVRLIRRYLVARQLGKDRAAKRVLDYLKKRPFKMILPDEQTPGMRRNYFARLPVEDQELAAAWGCVMLPEYSDCIFLNSEWRNPRTLYVRLNRQVPELGELGEVVWYPDEPEKEPSIIDRIRSLVRR